ncbi:uncharacterized protein LOC113279472 [Papaver somniferum]|uniref:uncharacterized protein LOC113279472 n=1 Tax=Papaver somniferum TaxID=3469 RepID=UPI000E7005F3|nr:uncharacterized protein LOC113279472 [Papaver somniferum]
MVVAECSVDAKFRAAQESKRSRMISLNKLANSVSGTVSSQVLITEFVSDSELEDSSLRNRVLKGNSPRKNAGVTPQLVINSSRQVITIAMEGVLVSFVHASCFPVTRRGLWQQLSSSDNNTPWLVMGDFNCVLRNEEKEGGRQPTTSVINDFCDWMDDSDLFEADFFGSKYTWANGKSGVRRILCKLDKAVINEAWLSKFENWRCKALPREVSDHSPLIGYPVVNARPKRVPFRVQKMWFTHSDFLRMVMESWNAPVSGSPAYIFPYNLKRLKIAMKEWNLRVFGNVYARIKHAKLTMEVALRISDEDSEDISKLNSAKEDLTTLQEIRTQQAIMLK